MRKVTTLLSTLALATTLAAQNLPQTERQYLSGHGCDDMVEWDFFCTNGRNSGKWTKIGVPSCWELQGFGTYQYGITFYGKAFPEGVADEKGMYKYEFEVPEKFLRATGESCIRGFNDRYRSQSKRTEGWFETSGSFLSFFIQCH